MPLKIRNASEDELQSMAYAYEACGKNLTWAVKNTLNITMDVPTIAMGNKPPACSKTNFEGKL
jgi:hypothetical protein